MNEDITLKARVTDLESRLARAEGTIEQLNKSIALGNRLTIWQFISFVVIMVGSMLGTIYWATGVMERRLEAVERNLGARLDATEKRFDERFAQMEKRFDERFAQMEKRFEDLRQVVLAKPAR
jgi:hypothetical protein